jgi:hypothetical protein
MQTSSLKKQDFLLSRFSVHREIIFISNVGKAVMIKRMMQLVFLDRWIGKEEIA